MLLANGFLVVLLSLQFFNVFSSRVTSDQIFELEMLRSECLEGTFSDSSSNYFGDIYRNGSTSCLSGRGVRSTTISDSTTRMQSEDTSSSFVSYLQSSASGLTIEFWMKASSFASTTEKQPIISLMYADTSMSSTACTLYENFEIYLEQATIKLLWRGTNTCRNPDYLTILSEGTYHVVLTIGSTITYLYLNGEQDNFDSLTFSASGFQSSYKLQLLSNSFIASGAYSSYYVPFYGDLYYVAMYSRALSAAEVLQNYEAGLENSIPTAYDMVASISEDGEVGSHYGSPVYYQSVVPVMELDIVYLNAQDQDETYGYPNYDSSDSPMEVYINSLPSSGSLFLYDGTQITSVPTQVPRNDTSYPIRIRPPFNQYSSSASDYLMSFTYYAVDGVTGVTSPTGTVNVNVSAVNDPPIPKVFSLTAYANTTIIFTLNGTDVDDHSISTAYISSWPAQGILYQVTSAGVITSTVISKSASAVELTSLYVGYLYTGSQENEANSSGLLYTDTFGFKVSDSSGALSVEKNSTIDIYPSIKAIASTALAQSSVYEETSGEIVLYGYDSADSKRALQFVISSLPSHGTLYDYSSGAELSVGSVLSTTLAASSLDSTGTGSVKVNYLSDKDYFNLPSKTYDSVSIGRSSDKFKFYVQVASDNDVQSTIVSQSVSIKNVNDKPVLTVLDLSYSIYAVGPNDDDQETVANITGSVLYDADEDVDPIFVELKVSYGYLTFTTKALSSIYFNQQICSSYGVTCSGDGSGDKKMAFAGTPSDVAYALSEIHYSSAQSNIEDTLFIYIYDGEDGDCFNSDADVLSSYTLRDGCYTSTGNVSITVLGTAGFNDDSSSAFTLPIQIWAAVVGGGIVALCCLFLLCRRQFKKYFTKQKKGDSGETSFSIDAKHDHSGVHKKKNTKRRYEDLRDDEKGILKEKLQDWCKLKSPEGEIYYYNKVTLETSWESPIQIELNRFSARRNSVRKNSDLSSHGSFMESFSKGPFESRKKGALPKHNELAVELDMSDADYNPDNWIREETSSGEVYYYNKKTKRTTWSRPKLDQLRRQINQIRKNSNGSNLESTEIELHNKAVSRPRRRSFVLEKLSSEQKEIIKSRLKNWSKMKTPEGQFYYFNKTSSQTTWENPIQIELQRLYDETYNQNETKEVRSPSPVAQLYQENATEVDFPSDDPEFQLENWQEEETEDGKTYYYNKKTRRTSWTKPTIKNLASRARAWNERRKSRGRARGRSSSIERTNKYETPNV